MKIATHDRGEIMHWLGSNKLSPALLDGKPVAVDAAGVAAGGDPSKKPARCGWRDFFAAMRGARLAFVYDKEQAGSWAFEEAPKDAREHHASFGHALAISAQFVKALVGRDGGAPKAA